MVGFFLHSFWACADWIRLPARTPLWLPVLFLPLFIPSFSHSVLQGSKVQGWLLKFVSRDREAAVLAARIWHFSVLKSMAQIIFPMKSIIWWPNLVQQPIRSKLLHVSQNCITKSSFPALLFFFSSLTADLLQPLEMVYHHDLKIFSNSTLLIISFVSHKT